MSHVAFVFMLLFPPNNQMSSSDTRNSTIATRSVEDQSGGEEVEKHIAEYESFWSQEFDDAKQNLMQSTGDTSWWLDIDDKIREVISAGKASMRGNLEWYVGMAEDEGNTTDRGGGVQMNDTFVSVSWELKVNKEKNMEKIAGMSLLELEHGSTPKSDYQKTEKIGDLIVIRPAQRIQG